MSSTASASEMESTVTTELVIASFPTPATMLLPSALRRLKREISSCSVRLRQYEPEDAIRAVRIGEVDLAIVHDYPGAAELDVEGLHRDDLFVEPLRWVVPRRGDLSGKTSIDGADVAERPWIGTVPDGPAHAFNEMLKTAARQQGFMPHVELETNDTQFAQAMVAAGLGVLLLPELALQHQHPEIVHQEATGADVRRRVSLLRPAGSRRTAVEVITEALRSKVGEFAATPRL
jgi:DNA-binding transcriptional LysR family regulator